MTVFANGLEISSKAQSCKVIAAFPDTCFTPPQTPATPPGVPVPYPNFATDSDLTSGTGTVKIRGKEVSQENSSKFSKISGDEAGSAPKKGIITSNNRGAAYAKKWSMDVKFEGKGVVRFSDLATTNHASEPGDDVPWVIAGKLNPAAGEPEEAHFCEDGKHSEVIVYPEPENDEVYTNERIAACRNEATNADQHFEAAAAQHNFDNKHLTRKSGRQISKGNPNGPQSVKIVCTICGKRREIDHVTDSGVPCEVKNTRSGFGTPEQKANNRKFMLDHMGVESLGKGDV